MPRGLQMSSWLPMLPGRSSISCKAGVPASLLAHRRDMREVQEAAGAALWISLNHREYQVTEARERAWKRNNVNMERRKWDSRNRTGMLANTLHTYINIYVRTCIYINKYKHANTRQQTQTHTYSIPKTSVCPKSSSIEVNPPPPAPPPSVLNTPT